MIAAMASATEQELAAVKVEWTALHAKQAACLVIREELNKVNAVGLESALGSARKARAADRETLAAISLGLDSVKEILMHEMT